MWTLYIPCTNRINVAGVFNVVLEQRVVGSCKSSLLNRVWSIAFYPILLILDTLITT